MDTISRMHINMTFKKYKTFSVLIYSYINTSGNWENEKLCGNTTPAGRSLTEQKHKEQDPLSDLLQGCSKKAVTIMI